MSVEPRRERTSKNAALVGICPSLKPPVAHFKPASREHPRLGGISRGHRRAVFMAANRWTWTGSGPAVDARYRRPRREGTDTDGPGRALLGLLLIAPTGTTPLIVHSDANQRNRPLDVYGPPLCCLSEAVVVEDFCVRSEP
jgi:hypothetical protein